jgi:hypothetical protein
LVVAIVGCLGLLAVMVTSSRLNPVSARLADVRARDTDALSYVVTYLVPFVARMLARGGSGSPISSCSPFWRFSMSVPRCSTSTPC